jgi:hypothetical protein
MAQLDEAKKAAKEDVCAATKLRAPLVKTLRRLRSKQDYCQKLRCRRIFGYGVCIPEDEVTAERTGLIQVWNEARPTGLPGRKISWIRNNQNIVSTDAAMIASLAGRLC